MERSLQKKLIKALQGDIPLEKEPFREIAVELGLSQEELLEQIKGLKEQGILRRLGAVLYHRQAGFVANAMVAWKVPDEKADSTGELFASFSEASHVYRRPAYPEWPYNLYTMIHGTSREDCESTIENMARKVGVDDYKILYSTREFKKTSMRYYPDNQDSVT